MRTWSEAVELSKVAREMTWISICQVGGDFFHYRGQTYTLVYLHFY